MRGGLAMALLGSEIFPFTTWIPGSNSGHQASRQAPLPMKPSSWKPVFCFL